MAKEIKFDMEAHDLLKHGADRLLDAVKVILGPKGYNIIISRSYGAPYITKDGVTVAKEVELEDEFGNVDVQLIREVASKTNEGTGGGMTITTVLAQSIINVGLKNITSSTNPTEIEHGVDKVVKAVAKSIRKQAKEVGDDLEQIARMTTISANGDEEIGQLIAQTTKKVKKEGVITVEEARGIDMTVDIVEGMQSDNSYASPYFVTDTEKMECRTEKSYILFYREKLSIIKNLLSLLEKMLQQDHSLLIVAENIESEALITLVLSRLRAGLKICGVEALSSGNHREGILRDTAILTGGTIINEDTGLTLEDITIDMLGSAGAVTVVKNKTTIVSGGGDKEAIADHANQIRHQIGNTKSDYDREKLREHLVRPPDGVAVLRIGADNEVEMKEKKDHVEDVLSATRAAVEGGIIPGGGTACIRAISSVEKLKGDIDGERMGVETIKRTIGEPLRQIIASAAREGAVVVQRVRDNKGVSGYNARIDSFEDLIKHGVIDPAKVTRMALESAASIAGMFLTTECTTANIKKDKPDSAAMAGVGGMDRMM